MNAALIQTEILPGGIPIRVWQGRPQPAVVVQVEKARTKARDAALIYSRNRLLAWSKWAKEHREQIGYPTISLLYKAMQMTKVGIVRGTAYPRAVTGKDGLQRIEYPINADGHATRSSKPAEIGEVPPEFVEVDEAVAGVPAKPREVGIAHYFTYGPIEDRVKETPYKRARYMQLLETFEYAVFVGLKAAAGTD
jgi:hypothetical protein